MRSRVSLVSCAVAAAAVTITACSGDSSSASGGSSGSSSSTTRTAHYRAIPTGVGAPKPASPSRPNIVFVLTDDLSWNLVKYMPHVRTLQRQGMTFTNYTVTDSLCCPSRASILSGNFPHNTDVFGNVAPAGGFVRFHRLGEERSTYATSVYRAGYRTAFMGKYLNDYRPNPKNPTIRLTRGAWVPPGWTQWNAVGDGYNEYRYVMASGHDFHFYGRSPRDYLTGVMKTKALQFLKVKSRRPYLLEIATFSPHYPYIPAPSDLTKFRGIKAPRTPAFDTLPKPAPSWLRGLKPLAPSDKRLIQHWWQLRVEAVQSVDRMVGALEKTIRAQGQWHNTVFVFSSDNGYHLGEYRLRSGKQTAYDTDIKVPLIVTGPGIAPGSTNPDMTQNIDLRPTFDQLAGQATPPNIDGHSLVPLLHGKQVPWRTYALVEHHHDGHSPADPDRQNLLRSPVPPTYNAIRSRTFLYVRYDDGEREYYNLVKDPFELHNLAPKLTPARIATLDAIMNRLTTCRGTAQCWRAGVPG